MEADLKRHLLTCAAALSAHRGQAVVTIARLATGDWRFFDRIESGCSFTARKYDAIMEWFAGNWPVNLTWPEDVPRPEADAIASVAQEAA